MLGIFGEVGENSYICGMLNFKIIINMKNVMIFESDKFGKSVPQVQVKNHYSALAMCAGIRVANRKSEAKT